MAPASNVFTSVYNMVLNTVNSAAFNTALDQAQSSINKVGLSITRASQAASSGTNASNIQKAAYDKLTATYERNAIAIQQNQAKLQAMIAGLNAAGQAEAVLQQQIATLSASITRQQALIAKHTAAGNANKSFVTGWKTQLAASQATLVQLTGSLTTAGASTQKMSDKVDISTARLKAQEARLAVQKIKVDELNKPLTKLETILASLMQGYKAIDTGTRAFEKMQAAVSKITSIGGGISSIFSGLGNVGGGLTTGIGGILKALNPVTAVVGTVQQSFSFLGQVAAYVFGHIIARSIEQAAGAIAQWAQDTLKATFDVSAGTERFIVALRAVIAVQKTNAIAGLSMADAMKSSTKEAAQLQHWLERLGLESIFSIEDVKLAFQHATEMGFNTDQAQRLTVATLDWAAANSKSGAQAEHLVFILGQIRNAGKLAYQDLYQLAQLGIGMDNINRQLAKQLGVTVDEIYALRDAGKITSEQGIEAITRYMEQFQGAASEQAHTLQGLITSLADIGPLLARNLLGPVSLETGKVGGIIGALQIRLEKFIEFMKQDWVFALTTQIGTALGGAADSAFAWGEKLMAEYAAGLWAGLNAVIDSLISIFAQVAYWLAPGSPPRILPDLDKWGTEAMTEYFKGFALADFGVFKDIGSQIESLLRSTLTHAEGDKTGILDRILGSREGLAQAVKMMHDVGNVTEEMFQQVFRSMGGASAELQAFIRTSFALEQQNRKVTAAQDALNVVTQKYNDLLKPVDDALQKVDDAQQNLLDDQRIAMLKLVANDPNATADEKRLAALEIQKIELGKQKRVLVANAKVEIDAAQKTLDAETAKQKVLADQQATQKALLDAQIDQNRLLQEYIDLLAKLNKEPKEKAAGGGTTPPPERKPPTVGGKFPEIPKIVMPQAILDFIAKLKELKAAWDNMWLNITTTLQPVFDAWQRVQDAWGRLHDKFIVTVPEINTKIAELIAWTVGRLATELPPAFDDIAGAIDNLGGVWEKNHTFILAFAGEVWKQIMNVILGTIRIIAKILKFVTGIMDQDWLEFWKGVWDNASKTTESIKKTIRAFLQVISGILNVWFAIFSGDWDRGWLGVKLLFTGTWTLIQTAFEVGVKAIKLAYDGFILLFKTAWDNDWLGVKTAFEGPINSLGSTFTGIINGIKTGWDSWYITFKAAWDTNWTAVQTKLETVMKAIGTALSGPKALLDAFVKVIMDFWTWLQGKSFHVGIDTGGGGGGGGGDKTTPSNFPSMAVTPPASAGQLLAGLGMGNSSRVVNNNYNYSPTYSGTPASPVQDFGVMQVWSR